MIRRGPNRFRVLTLIRLCDRIGDVQRFRVSPVSGPRTQCLARARTDSKRFRELAPAVYSGADEDNNKRDKLNQIIEFVRLENTKGHQYKDRIGFDYRIN